MFYSHTFLARKGPLGTVWFAAHLQNKLKKSHYVATDIPSTVERIMFPEVPLALRMSGHLLLGIVRIYSKKVQFLYEDCNAVWTSLRKAFASLDLNLPEDARQAPVQAITLPDTFDLDAMDLDVEFNFDGAYDHHLKSHEEITITDYTNQIPIETEIYVTISFDEGIKYGSSSAVEIPPSDVEAQEHVIHQDKANDNDAVTGPSSQIGEQITSNGDNEIPSNSTRPDVQSYGLQDPGSIHHADMPTHSGDSSTKVSIEKGRDGVHVSPGIPPIFSSPVQPPSFDDVTKKKDIVPPATEDTAGSGGQISPLQQSSGPRASFASLQMPMNILEGSVSFAIQPTPSAQKPKVRARKRKQLYDEAPVLKNKFMKKALEDPSDLKRKRKNIPSSALHIWKLKNNLRKEQVFLEPSITGLCSDLCNIFNKDYMSSKLQCLEEACPDSVVASPGSAANAFPEPGLAHSPAPVPETATDSSPPNRNAEFQTPCNENAQEIEGSTHFAENDDGNIIPPPKVTTISKSDHVTASPSDTVNSTPFPAMETGRRVFSTPDFSVPSTHDESQLDTPDEYTGDQIGLEYPNLSDIPELNASDAEELWFLEADNSTPTGSQGTQGIDTLSIRTRAVAQFLKKQSPTTPISEDLFGDLSLNKLLQGKTRKLCARMFFETLVLKSNGLVDVQQEVPYGDIILKLTPEFSKAQI
ncbi:sister chromatid cohesion 1 protein 3 [Humulus lupulus]|uniref:sister chromatid cohesion 1 protein 3 n=1 Tax=Humulus lupulus TaxID=3486 RepID=UPI002B40590B|nr:sister chromatid cohesion 1 protein 3 [Humulus lupulus]